MTGTCRIVRIHHVEGSPAETTRIESGLTPAAARAKRQQLTDAEWAATPKGFGWTRDLFVIESEGDAE